MMTSAVALAALCAASYVQPASFSAADAHVLVDEAGLVVAFRGSVSLCDWVVDFHAAPHAVASHPDLGRCHAGFLADAVAVAPLIVAWIDGRPVTVTGHSKGAAEALLFAALLVVQGSPPVQVTTFGCPRVAAAGNTRLAALLAGLPGQDYRHRDDPVTFDPPWLIHPRPIVQLGAPTFEVRIIDDHFIAAYEAALTQPIEGTA